MQGKYNLIEHFEVAFEVVAPPAFLKMVNLKESNEENLNYTIEKDLFNTDKDKKNAATVVTATTAAKPFKKPPLKKTNAMKNIFENVKINFIKVI